MISATTTVYSKPSVHISSGTKRQSPQLLHLTVRESILQINNDGVSLLQAGNNKAAMIRLARCLAIMRTSTIEGEKEVHYQFTRSVQKNNLNLSPRYVFAAPLEIVGLHTTSDSCCSTCCSSNDTEKLTCKLLSLVLFNLSLAHHLHALELFETMQYDAQDEIQRRNEACAFLEKSLRLYELCHSSLLFINSGLLCSDLSIAVVVMNNVGEVHKELHQQQEQNQHHEYSRTAMACSEQLIQIFMFFAANDASKRLEGLGDILSNAMATLNGSQIVAAAA